MRVGLDVGGTKIDALALGADGTILARTRIPTGWGDHAVVTAVHDAVEALAGEGGFPVADVASVGIGIPGLIDADAGRVLHAVNLGVTELDLADAVRVRLPVPVSVENDVKAAALGAGSLRGDAHSMAYLNLGTGVAAGIVIDGALWRGAHGTAGEVGHLSVDPRGRVCGCGQRGCIETFCGGGAVSKAWGRGGELPLRDIFDLAESGDAFALELREGVAFGAASAVRSLVLSADVETVVIGGGVTALGDRLLDDIVRRLRQEGAQSPFIGSLHLDERIELLPAGSPAAALGAALVGAARLPAELV
ncbi:MAG: sugar kinase [Microbacterium sp. 14-71-5]|uniref:ROK family protein n=1 Tax=Microbacterium sp. 13-71-7 TaxID=1970399 RepID=UPI000BCDF55E|nr:ROK family protein [Microbacterium sp. 13-71-7]OZB82382.1 MAG: sugar kinase [Microbacterium sp. 13-71-7]OZB89772.1 MAG: sugar kinase [Microbacterium sp. 14-71-5]